MGLVVNCYLLDSGRWLEWGDIAGLGIERGNGSECEIRQTVEVNLGGGSGLVPHEGGEALDVHTALQHGCGVGMAENMRMNPFLNPGAPPCPTDSFSQSSIGYMVASLGLAAPIN